MTKNYLVKRNTDENGLISARADLSYKNNTDKNARVDLSDKNDADKNALHDAEIIVNFENVSLTYHDKTGETLAVSGLDFRVYRGELLGIVGPSGCGKTTVLSIISSIIKPSEGRVVIGGEEAKDRRDKCGYMLQRDELFPWLTISQNVLLGAKVKKMKGRKDYAYALLDKYGLGDFKNRYPSQLSGGMRQRVALIRTLATAPELLLLDEPFGALDFQTRLHVVGDVHSIIKNEKKTAVFVTHDISEAISMCDRILILSSRPAKVKKTIDLAPIKELSPIERRESPLFQKYFEDIWKNLQNNKD